MLHKKIILSILSINLLSSSAIFADPTNGKIEEPEFPVLVPETPVVVAAPINAAVAPAPQGGLQPVINSKKRVLTAFAVIGIAPAIITGIFSKNPVTRTANIIAAGIFSFPAVCSIACMLNVVFGEDDQEVGGPGVTAFNATVGTVLDYTYNKLGI